MRPDVLRARRAALRVLAGAAALLLVSACAVTGRLGQIAAPAGLPPAVDLDATPFHPQTEHQCGPAALSTVLGAAGRDVAPGVLAGEIFVPDRKGSLQPELIAAVRARDLLPVRVAPALDAVLAEVAAGRPVLVLQRLGVGPWPAWHYAVVVGYDTTTGHILLRSGTERRKAERAAVFDATWERAGRWGVVVLEPGTLPARPDLQRYVEGAAGLEAVGQLDAAERSYNAARQRWPDAALPAVGLANIAAVRGDWAEAERLYRAVLAQHPGDASALNNRAESLRQLGCPTLARAVLADGRAAIPPGDPLLPQLARTLAEIEADLRVRPVDAPGCDAYAAGR